MSGKHGLADFWVVKLDPSGNLVWQRCLGGSDWDSANCVQQTSDGGYVVAGYTLSNDGDVSGNQGNYDFWVVKLDPSGNKTWERCLGGTADDWAYSIQQTSDGGYVVAGETWSNDRDVSGKHGESDYWVVKLSSPGHILWQKCLGGSSSEGASSIQQTSDGGFVVAGETWSNDGDVSGNHGSSDFWAVKLDKDGKKVWQRCLGGTLYERANGIRQTSDGGYVVAGGTRSNDVDVSGNHGESDYWVVKLRSIIVAPDEVAAGSTDNVATAEESGVAYLWTITNGTITSATNVQKINFTAGASGIIRLDVRAFKNCSCNEYYKYITIVSPDCSWSSSSPVCNGTPVNFTGPAYMDSYNWSFGDGAASSNQNPSHLYTAFGTYKVNLTTTKLGINKTCEGTVTILSGANCSWTSNAPVCNGTPVNFTGPAYMDSYNWSFGDRSPINSSQNPAHLYSAPGIYNVSLRTTRCGTNKTCNGTVTILSGANCSWTSNAPVCNGAAVQFTGPAGMDVYSWDFGDHQYNTSQSPIHLYSAPGIYNVSLNATKGNCSKICNDSVRVKSLPDCRWRSNTPVCNGTPVQFTGPAGMDAYQWSFGDDASSPDQSPSHLYSHLGTYIVVLTATKEGCTKKCPGNVVVTAPECNWISSSPVCNGTPVHFEFTGRDNMDSYNWSFGDGRYSTSKNPIHLYSDPRDYIVNLTTRKANCSATCSRLVTVKAMPDCNWTSNSPVCYGTPVNFTGPADMDSWNWSFGDGKKDTSANPEHIYSAIGTYNVSLMVRKDECSKVCNGTVEVMEPDCLWSSSAPVCNGTPVEFNSLTGMDSYSWTFGDGAASSIQRPLHLYSAPGTYNVSLTTTKSGIEKTCNGTVDVLGGADCHWRSNAPVCEGTPVQFTGPERMESYNWSFGDGAASSEQSPVHLYSAPGTYAVNLTTKRCGTNMTCEGTVTILSGADCRWSSNSPVCNGTPVQFRGPAGMDKYSWDFGDGAASSAKDPSHLYPALGNYNVSLNATNSSCSKICNDSVSVKPLPDCSWSSTSPVCNGTPVQFRGPDNMDSYSWSFGDSSIFNSSQNPAHLYSAPGIYNVSLNVTNDSCSTTCSGQVRVKPMPDCSWSSTSPVCNGTPVLFIGPAGMDPYSWDFGDNTTSSAKDPAHLYSAPGTYNVSLDATNDSCSATCPGQVIVGPIPDCSWSSNAPVCNGTPVLFIGPAGMDSYSWDFGDNTTSSAKDPAHLYSAPGTYNVSLNATKGNCSKICNDSVSVKPLPDCSWSSTSPVCNGTPVNFTAPAGMESYNWSFGDGQYSSSRSPSHLYPAVGSYTVSLTVVKEGCSNECEGRAKVNPVPECRWTSSSPVYDGVPVEFKGPEGMDSYAWELGDGSKSTAEDPSHVYPGSGTYGIELTVTKGGCSASSLGSVLVRPSTKPPVQFSQFSEEKRVAGTGVVDLSASILDKEIALEFGSAMAGEGDIEIESEHAYSQNADKIRRNLSSVNESNESNMNLYGSTKLAFSGDEPLVGESQLRSREFYGGMGASVQEVFVASEIDREQTAFFAEALPYRPLNNSAETLPGELERAGRDTARVDQLMRSREGIYNPAELMGIQARAAFNGTWGTDTRWHRMFNKDIASREIFTGKFEAERLLKFRRYPVAERGQRPCEGIDC